MTTLGELHGTLVNALITALADVQVGGAAVQVATGFPPTNALQSLVVQQGRAYVGVYDTQLSRNSTRWNPFVASQTVTPATLTTQVSGPLIGPGGGGTITLGGSVTVGDAVSCCLTNGSMAPQQQGAAVVTGGGTDTPTTMAAALAGAINADTTMSEWVAATASGPVVTLTSLLANGALALSSFTGNGGTQTMEIGRRNRQERIIVWTPTEDARQAVSDPIETFLASASQNFGIQFPDGTWGRIIPGADYYLEDDTLQDAYRRDFTLAVDYPITNTDALYAVLAPVLSTELS